MDVKPAAMRMVPILLSAIMLMTTGSASSARVDAANTKGAVENESRAGRSAARRVSHVPRIFRDSWGNQNPCDPDSDTQMHVQARRILFYEGSIVIRTVTVNSPTQITIGGEMHISGVAEGDPTTVVLELMDNGTRVMLRDVEPVSEPLILLRCTSMLST